MTAPQERADDLGDILARLSAITQEGLVGDLRDALAGLLTSVVRRWVLEFGDVDAVPDDTTAFSSWLGARLREVMVLQPGVDEALAGAVLLAYAAGLDHAALTAWWPAATTAARAPVMPAVLGVIVQEQVTVAALRLAERVAAGGLLAAQTAVGTGQRAITRIEATVAVELTSAAARAVRDVAAERAADVVWIAERDACLGCLAYAGRVASSGASFPSDLTFDDRPLPQRGPVMGPPRHVNCRCVLELLHPDDSAIAAGLRREARRSVLRGESLDSLPARLDAAGRLLARGADLPKSVEARAALAVARGEFARKDRGTR